MESSQVARYVRLCKGLEDPGQLLPLEQVNTAEKIKGLVNKSPKNDWYLSYFQVNEDAVDYFKKAIPEIKKKENSLKGYKELGYSNKLIFDIDFKDNIEEAKNKTLDLLLKLHDEGVKISDSTEVYFSGGKGFHVEVTLDSEIDNKTAKTVCKNIAESVGIPKKVFDTTIYNVNRIFRVPGTVHQKTGLYKIRIEPNQLKKLDVDSIINLAKTNVQFSKTIVPADSSFIEKYKVSEKSNKSVVVESDLEVEGIRGLDTIDFTRMPKGIPRCLYALSKGIFVPGRGQRHEIYLRLAAFYANQGMEKGQVHRLLKGVAELNHSLYPEAEAVTKEELYHNIVESVFDGTFKHIPGASGVDPENETIKDYCDVIEQMYPDVRCCLHHKKSNRNTVVSIDEVSGSFQKFASNLNKNVVRTGINLIDDYMKLTVGTTTLIAGAAGTGKTTLALNIMENANRNGLHCMMFSMDMHRNLVYLKLAQKLTDYDQDQILAFHETNNQAKMKEIKDAISSVYDKTYFDFSSTLTLEAMEQKIHSIEEKTGNKIKMVLVDYASRISGPYSDSSANERFNALKSKEIASNTDTAFVILCQISRNSGDGSNPLRTKRAAKGAGDWEETAENVITVWRPFLGQEGEDDIMRMYLAKNRMGKEVERPLHWNGKRGTIKDMTLVDYEDYKVEREESERTIQKQKQKKLF